MDSGIKIKNFSFRKDEKLFISFTNHTDQTIKIHGGHEKDVSNFIHDINRLHMKDNPTTDGCLPSNSIGVKDPSVNISPMYLMHCFINIMEQVLRNDTNAVCFERNKDIVSLPTSNDNLEKIMMAMTSTENLLSSSSSSSSSLVEEGRGNVNFSLFLRVIIEKMFTMQQNLKETISKKCNKIAKTSAAIGRINHELLRKNRDEADFLSTGLQQCSDVIHSLMRENAQQIRDAVLDPNNTSMVAIKKLHAIHPLSRPLYANENISFALMYECIGEVFNVLFINIIPQNSMMEAMQGSFYNAAVLSELKLQDRFSDLLCLPVLYRFVYSCFEDKSLSSSSHAENLHEKYLHEHHSGVWNNIIKLQRVDDDDERVNILGIIAQKSDIRDKKFIEALYWVLNQKRLCTFEYYIILMSVLYISARCSNVSKLNKLTNVVRFITPIYSIMTLFQKYVNNLGITDSLCSATMESFSMLHQEELKKNLEIFATSIV